MGVLYLCSACCMVLSIWAIIQLTTMGVLYYLEVVALFGDVAPETDSYKDYEQLKSLTKQNYMTAAMHCWAVAGIYALTLAMSCIGLRKATRAEKKAALLLKDDEYSCQPENAKKSNV